MELFRELFITVGISLVVSFVIAKLFSMASPSHHSTTLHNNTTSSSSPPSLSLSLSIPLDIQESVFIARNPVQKSTRVSLVDEAVELNQLENDLSRARTIGSTLNFDDDNEIVDSRDESEAVGLENTKILEGSILTEAAEVEFDELVFDEIPETAKFREIVIESGKGEVNEGEIEGNKGNESDGVVSNENYGGEQEGEGEIEGSNKGNESDGVVSNENYGGQEGEGDGSFGDWEGIERTELEKRFGDAVVFVGSKSNADRIWRLDSDAKMQLHGLHKLVIEGPCSVPSPMALKVSARAKWNAWQQLGDMSREEAMEQYISLLSKSIPGWIGDDAKGFSDEKSAPAPTINVRSRHVTENKSTLTELNPGDEGCGMTGRIQTP